MVQDGYVLVDKAWLRKESDKLHINEAELTSIVRRINLAIKWGARKIRLYTDSSAVDWWLSALRSRSRKIRLSGDSKVLVKRRLSIIQEALEEMEEWSVKWVPMTANRADPLTRVPDGCKRPGLIKSLLRKAVASSGVCDVDLDNDGRLVERVHQVDHASIDGLKCVRSGLGLLGRWWRLQLGDVILARPLIRLRPVGGILWVIWE